MVSATFKGTRGFTYVGLLFAIVLLGVVLSVTGVVWHTQSLREKELELLFVGNQYREAITSYRGISVNGPGTLPKSLDDLIEDRRFPQPVRHLRKRYRDPMTNAPEWGLVRGGDGIAGVFSLSNQKPLKTAHFKACCVGFEAAESYRDWKFAVTAAATASTPTAPGSSAVPAGADSAPAPRRR